MKNKSRYQRSIQSGSIFFAPLCMDRGDSPQDDLLMYFQTNTPHIDLDTTLSLSNLITLVSSIQRGIVSPSFWPLPSETLSPNLLIHSLSLSLCICNCLAALSLSFEKWLLGLQQQQLLRSHQLLPPPNYHPLLLLLLLIHNPTSRFVSPLRAPFESPPR